MKRIDLAPLHSGPLKVQVVDCLLPSIDMVPGAVTHWCRWLPGLGWEAHFRRAFWRPTLPAIDGDTTWLFRNIRCRDKLDVGVCRVLCLDTEIKWSHLDCDRLAVVGFSTLPNAPAERWQAWGITTQTLYVVDRTATVQDEHTRKELDRWLTFWDYTDRGYVQDLQHRWVTRAEYQQQTKERALHDAEERRRFQHRG